MRPRYARLSPEALQLLVSWTKTTRTWPKFGSYTIFPGQSIPAPTWESLLSIAPYRQSTGTLLIYFFGLNGSRLRLTSPPRIDKCRSTLIIGPTNAWSGTEPDLRIYHCLSVYVRSAVPLFDRLTQAIIRKLRSEGIPAALGYIDDFWVSAETVAECLRAYTRLIELLTIPTAAKRERGAKLCTDFLARVPETGGFNRGSPYFASQWNAIRGFLGYCASFRCIRWAFAHGAPTSRLAFRPKPVFVPTGVARSGHACRCFLVAQPD
jgi:hypothetical protein